MGNPMQHAELKAIGIETADKTQECAILRGLLIEAAVKIKQYSQLSNVKGPIHLMRRIEAALGPDAVHYWGADGRCIHCGAGNDAHHSYTCPTNLHPDRRDQNAESEAS